MYYWDLVASLPHLRSFEGVERLPITPLRLGRRLGLLEPGDAGELARARPAVGWRPERVAGRTDAEAAAELAALLASPLAPPLRDYVAFRRDQKILLAALRRRRDGLGLPPDAASWGAGELVGHLRRHWAAPDFRLAHRYPWLPRAAELAAAGDALGLERATMAAAWHRLDRCSERSAFGFEAVFAYVFKWDILETWLAWDAGEAKNRFRDLIDKVTHANHN